MVNAQKILMYQADVNKICSVGVQCPPQNASEKTINAFRWVKNPISDNCFKPPAVRNPRRLHSMTDLEKRCSCWALSMHTSLKDSINAFQHVELSFPNARKNFGEWVAEGTLTPNHGKCTPQDTYGHFDLHEYNASSVSTVFSVHSVIPEII